MHTVRNRVASKPRHKGKTQPPGPARKPEPAFLLKSGNPPAFPAGLIIPAPRGAMITAVPWPDVGGGRAGVSARSAPRSKGAQPAKVRKSKAPKHRAATSRKARRTDKPAVTLTTPLAQEAPVPMMTVDLLDRALAVKPALAEDALILKPTPRPAGAAATSTPDPIPRSKALAPARSTALLDIIGYWLRDAGNWLVRRNMSRRQAEERTRMARASARLHALQSQHEALEALQETAKMEAIR